MKDHDGDVLSIGDSERRPASADASRVHTGERPSGERDVAFVLEELRRLNAELERQNRELRRQQLELAASRDRWWDLWAHAPVGCVTLDGDGRVVDANLAATVMLGAARPRLLGRRLADWMDDHDTDTLHRARRGALSHATPRTHGVRLHRPDGEIIAANLRSVSVRGENGRLEWLTVLVEEPASSDHE